MSTIFFYLLFALRYLGLCVYVLVWRIAAWSAFFLVPVLIIMTVVYLFFYAFFFLAPAGGCP